MNTKQTVLAYLHQHAGEWVTSTELVERLAVSRVSISKAVKQLVGENYQIESQAGKGYFYVTTAQLSEAIIADGVGSMWQVEVHDQIDSTNIRAKQLVAKRSQQPFVVVANEQTAGYGRFGRPFFSPSETGLYLSIAIPVTGKINPGQMTTTTAVAVSRVLERMFNVTIQIKWVNDLIINQHKVTGILSEAVTDFESGRIANVIVGIGINLLTSDVLDDSLKTKVGSVVAQQQPLDRNQVAVEIIREFERVQKVDDPRELMQEYRHKSLVIGHLVEVNLGAEVLEGTVTNITDDGALQLQTGDRLLTVSAGEITKVNLLEGDYHG